VEVVCGKTSYKTNVINNDLNPEFNETFEFSVRPADEILTVKVWDYDAVKSDDILGTVEIPLYKLKAGVSYHQWSSSESWCDQSCRADFFPQPGTSFPSPRTRTRKRRRSHEAPRRKSSTPTQCKSGASNQGLAWSSPCSTITPQDRARRLQHGPQVLPPRRDSRGHRGDCARAHDGGGGS
jgi:hypothetical protein